MIKPVTISVDINPTWTISYKDVWANAMTHLRTIRKVLNDVGQLGFRRGGSSLSSSAVQVLATQINKLTASCHLVTMDRLAYGADNGQIYLIPALKLISYLFLSHDQAQENFGMPEPSL